VLRPNCIVYVVILCRCLTSQMLRMLSVVNLTELTECFGEKRIYTLTSDCAA